MLKQHQGHKYLCIYSVYLIDNSVQLFTLFQTSLIFPGHLIHFLILLENWSINLGSQVFQETGKQPKKHPNGSRSNLKYEIL